jgi:hypothetical protein
MDIVQYAQYNFSGTIKNDPVKDKIISIIEIGQYLCPIFKKAVLIPKLRNAARKIRVITIFQNKKLEGSVSK